MGHLLNLIFVIFTVLLTLFTSISPVYPQDTFDLQDIKTFDTPVLSDFPNAQFLVNIEWLLEHIDDPDLIIVDTRSLSESYLEGHIPGAVYMDIDDIRRERKGIKGMLPSKKKMERILGGLGIGNDTMVVIYDSEDGVNASLLFWTIEYMGHKKIALLDGGIEMWIDEGFPLEEETPVPELELATFTARISPKRLVNAKWIVNNIDNSEVVFVDTRSKLEFLGIYKLSKRGGHIPNAVNIEWKKNLKEDELSKVFKSREELVELYEDEGITRDKIIVVYSQSFYRAAHTYFVFRLLGYDVRGYDGSWEEWGNREDLPVE